MENKFRYTARNTDGESSKESESSKVKEERQVTYNLDDVKHKI